MEQTGFPIRIKVDKERYKELLEKYPAVKGIIMAKTDSWEEYFNKNPFNEQYKNVWLDEIKENLTFINIDYDQRKKDLPIKYDEENEDYKLRTDVLSLLLNKRIGEATELIVERIEEENHIYTTRDDIKSEMWIYKNGIYIPQGKTFIKERVREILYENYSTYILNSVVSKIEADTFIDYDKFFSQENKDEIAVLNGILNIKTKELSGFTPKKIFQFKLPITYNPSKKCPKIEKFLKDVLKKEEDIKVFYEWVGFGLMKEYKYEKAMMMVGNGRNGKGKSIELLKRLVGAENCCSIPLTSLKPESFSISELFGKLFNLAGDIGNEDLKDTSMFKSTTGRDLIGGKRKFQRDIFFENYAKFTFACNELPMVYDMSKGFWDRWILLEYPYTFVSQYEYNKSKDKSNLKIKDDDIIQKISSPEEMSGLLNKALEGYDRLIQNKRFSSTQGSEEVKATWIRKSNSFIAFCFDNIEENQEGKISKKDLRKRYSDYCKEHKISNKSDYVIKRTLQETYGVTDEKLNPHGIGSNYEWYWIGIKWKK